MAEVDDVLRQNGKRLSDSDLACRKAEEASLRRYEASEWLRKTLGGVAEKDLPAQPSEEEFMLCLRSGIILCSVLNKVQPGVVPKVVEAPSDTIIIPDGAALSAYQYFENVRNFLDSLEVLGIPVFEPSDLEQGGKTFRIVNCVLALKSYQERKEEGGGKGIWKFNGTVKSPLRSKQFVRKQSDLFMNSILKNSSGGDKVLHSFSCEKNSCINLGQELNEMVSCDSMHKFVHELISDKKPEEVPLILENVLSKVVEECERRLASQNEQVKTILGDVRTPSSDKCLEMEASNTAEDMLLCKGNHHNYEVRGHALKNPNLFGHQQTSIQALKDTFHSMKEDIEKLCKQYQEDVNKLGEHLRRLAHATSNHQKVLEENRKLYNQVQDLKGNIRVYCRIRPFLPGRPPGSSIVENTDEQNLTIITPAKQGKRKKSFTFNRVFVADARQDEVFSDTQPLIRSVLDGYNVCIFAYGQTGSGKTFTMTGPKELTEESMGVNYRALNDLFLISEQRKESMSYEVSVQMIEIYNEQVRDLLLSDGVQKKTLEIRNNSSNGINVPDANLVPVTSPSDVINLMNLGHKNRAVGSTLMNDRSSRSHSCLTVHIQGRNLATGAVLRGCMHLVDLAGSERADKTEAAGDRLKEAQHINKSLSALGDVISSLARKSSHIPYRNSKLTQLLQDSLGGQAKTLMFVHISPEPDAHGETISTLKFAERVSTVELGAVRTNKESSDVKELKEEIASLRAALLQKEREELEFRQCRSFGSSPANSYKSDGDANKTEVPSPATPVSTIQEIMNSPCWPSPGLLAKERSEPGDWHDKIMLTKQRSLSIHLENGDVNRALSPDMFSPKNTKIHPGRTLRRNLSKGSVDSGLRRIQREPSAVSEVDTESCDSFNLDSQWIFNVPKTSCVPNGVRSKVKKSSPMQGAKTPERSSLKPNPSTKTVPNGSQWPLHKPGRQPASVNVKRKPAAGK